MTRHLRGRHIIIKSCSCASSSSCICPGSIGKTVLFEVFLLYSTLNVYPVQYKLYFCPFYINILQGISKWACCVLQQCVNRYKQPLKCLNRPIRIKYYRRELLIVFIYFLLHFLFSEEEGYFQNIFNVAFSEFLPSVRLYIYICV